MNKIIDYVLRNRLLILVFAIIVMAAGYMSYKQLPIDAFPDVSPNGVRSLLKLKDWPPRN